VAELPEFAKAWMNQWRSAAVALAEQRRRELAALTPEEALEASEDLLSLELDVELRPSRWSSSGLVEQQALFHNLRRP